MAHFYLSTQNTRNKTKGICATKTHGQNTHQRGYNIGVRVISYVNVNGDDMFKIFATSGSNNATPDVFIGTVYLDYGKPAFSLDIKK